MRRLKDLQFAQVFHFEVADNSFSSLFLHQYDLASFVGFSVLVAFQSFANTQFFVTYFRDLIGLFRLLFELWCSLLLHVLFSAP